MNGKSPGPSYPCPCCGYLSFEEPAGSYALCPFCFWEDDLIQLAFPRYKGGANKVSLAEAQANFAAFGACEREAADKVTKPGTAAERDLSWRPLVPADPVLDWGNRAQWKLWDERKDLEPVLYYWREDYWLHDPALMKKLG